MKKRVKLLFTSYITYLKRRKNPYTYVLFYSIISNNTVYDGEICFILNPKIQKTKLIRKILFKSADFT